MNKDNKVLQPYTMGDLELPNRVVMAPMTRSRATNPENAPEKGLHDLYYAQRASAGLIITEGAQVSKRGVGYIYTPGIHSKAQVEGWKKVTKAVHDAGGRIFIQLWHVGRISHPDFHDGELPLAPSALNPEVKSYTYEGFKDTVTPSGNLSMRPGMLWKQVLMEWRSIRPMGICFTSSSVRAAIGERMDMVAAKRTGLNSSSR
jgi:N-ethylmaleimide reductase